MSFSIHQITGCSLSPSLSLSLSRLSPSHPFALFLSWFSLLSVCRMTNISHSRSYCWGQSSRLPVNRLLTFLPSCYFCPPLAWFGRMVFRSSVECELWGLDWNWKNGPGLWNADRPTALYYSYIYIFLALCPGRLTGRSGNLPTLPKVYTTLNVRKPNTP